MSKAEPGISQKQLLGMLDSSDAEDRKQGWKTLCHLLHGGTLPVTKELITEVLKRLKRPEPPEVSEYRCQAFASMYYTMHQANEAMQKELDRAAEAKRSAGVFQPSFLPPGSLAWWVYQDFRMPSWIAYLSDVKRRDETAVIDLMNCLGRGQFTSVQRMAFKPGTFQFSIPQDAAIKVVVFVGRWLLFFKCGTEGAQWEMKEARYAFPPLGALEYHPERWPDPDYHTIYERIAPGIRPLAYRTTWVDGVLTDYAIVQKYEVLVNEHTVVVIRCAGCTQLGTYAAVHWLISDLFDEHQPGRPIPAPPAKSTRKTRNRSQRGLEALIKVRAHLDPKQVELPPMQIELLDLRVDGLAWYQDAFQWKVPTPKHIVLFYPKNQQRTSEDVSAIWLNAHQTDAKHDSETRRLLTALCLLKQELGPVIPISRLAQDTRIWEHGQLRQEQEVAARLRLLNDRHLGQAVKIDSKRGVCSLNAEVLFTDDQD
jgi:hypothetical protein